MRDKLWAGTFLKLENASFQLEQMQRALDGPPRTGISVAQQASGTIIDGQWQRSFYACLDAFLSAARSVPDIIQCCFGRDKGHPKLKTWFKSLPTDEQALASTEEVRKTFFDLAQKWNVLGADLDTAQALLDAARGTSFEVVGVVD
jgi:hypothetical protein